MQNAFYSVTPEAAKKYNQTTFRDQYDLYPNVIRQITENATAVCIARDGVVALNPDTFACPGLRNATDIFNTVSFRKT